MKKCPFCAEEIQEVALVCKHCGRDLFGSNRGQVTIARAPRKWPYILLAILVLLVLLSAIGQQLKSARQATPRDSTAATANAGGNQAPSNPAHTLVSSKPEVQRGAMLRNIAISAGGKCDRADRTFLRGRDSDGNAYWAVACRNGNSYLIQMKADDKGSTTVTSCDVFRSVSGGDCFTAF